MRTPHAYQPRARRTYVPWLCRWCVPCGALQVVDSVPCRARQVVDNLLLVHCLDNHVVLLFDIKINAQHPITAPLPLGLLPAPQWGAELYTPHWSLAAPNYVVDSQVAIPHRVQWCIHTVSEAATARVKAAAARVRGCHRTC